MYQYLTQPGQLFGTEEDKLLIGTPGNDEIFGTSVDDLLSGLDG